MTPTQVVRRVAGSAVALASALAIGALSGAPYTADRADYGIVRLAWRARGERVEQCRRLTTEELERLPAHMRQQERCEGRILPYRLHVRVDGARALDELVQAAGARHDRPLYVYHELPLEPGTHALAVAFAREGDVPAGAHEEEKGTPGRLALDTMVALSPRRILLVTYDDDARRLVVRDGTP
jgi:hypothetical protein